MHRAIKQSLKLALLFKNWPIRFLEATHLLPNKPITMKLRNGLLFDVRPYSSDISCLQSIAMDDEYRKYFDVMPSDTVIDIGANIGSFSVTAAHKEPTAKFFSVEPMKNNFELLQKNIAINKLTNVTPVRAGISDTNDNLVFYHGKDTWFASGSLYNIDAVEQTKREEVPCLRLEELFIKYNITVCDFFKMDCEGAEYKILFDCPDYIWSRIKKIALEFHNFEPGKTQHDLVSLLQSKGFKTVLPKKYQNKQIGLIFAVK